MYIQKIVIGKRSVIFMCVKYVSLKFQNVSPNSSSKTFHYHDHAVTVYLPQSSHISYFRSHESQYPHPFDFFLVRALTSHIQKPFSDHFSML